MCISIIFICASTQQITAQDINKNVSDSIFLECFDKININRTQLFAYCEDTAKKSVTRKDEHKKVREILEAKKKEYLTKEMNLTEEEAKIFFPVLDQFETKHRKIGYERKKLLAGFEKEENSLTDSKAKQLNKQWYDLQKQEFDLMLEYEKIFETILTPKKLFLFHKAHTNFMRGLIKNVGSKNKTDNFHKSNFNGKL